MVSWDKKGQSQAHVNRENKNGHSSKLASIRHGKNADSLAQANVELNVKKDVIRSLVTISLVLILELMVYLAWMKFIK